MNMDLKEAIQKRHSVRKYTVCENRMKVLMINGSPHKEGNTALALREATHFIR